METILIIAVIGTLNIACFLIGIKAGQHEEIKAPDVSKINPLNIYREHKEKEEEKKEAEKLEKILGNMDRYDGTAKGQEDIE